MFHIEHYGRFWALYKDEELICICVYFKGAKNVKRILEKSEGNPASEERKEIATT